MQAEHLPHVSVITCFFNEERFLQQAIESVVAQQYTSWELLLVDDGSTDASSQIAASYVKKFPDKIFYYEHEGHANRGLAASRNKGIHNARGTWIALLDADDVWLTDKLSAETALIKKYPDASMFCQASTYWYSWEGDQKQDMVIQVGVAAEGIYRPPALLQQLYPLGKGAAPCPSGLLIRRSTALQYGGFEESFKGIYQLYEDQSFLVKMYLGEPVVISHRAHNLYRQRTGSIVQSVLADGHYGTVRKHFLEWLQRYCQNHQVIDPVVNNLVKRSLAEYKCNVYTIFAYKIPGWFRRVFNKIKQAI